MRWSDQGGRVKPVTCGRPVYKIKEMYQEGRNYMSSGGGRSWKRRIGIGY